MCRGRLSESNIFFHSPFQSPFQRCAKTNTTILYSVLMYDKLNPLKESPLVKEICSTAKSAPNCSQMVRLFIHYNTLNYKQKFEYKKALFMPGKSFISGRARCILSYRHRDLASSSPLLGITRPTCRSWAGHAHPRGCALSLQHLPLCDPNPYVLLLEGRSMAWDSQSSAYMALQ